MPSEPNEALVTQADRDAAADYLGDIFIRDGRVDHHPLVQAFARRRIAAEKLAHAAGMEHAAVIAENHMADCLDDKDIQKRWPEIKRRNAVYATAIRQAIGADNGR
jgi:hypothetical protein